MEKNTPALKSFPAIFPSGLNNKKSLVCVCQRCGKYRLFSFRNVTVFSMTSYRKYVNADFLEFNNFDKGEEDFYWPPNMTQYQNNY